MAGLAMEERNHSGVRMNTQPTKDAMSPDEDDGEECRACGSCGAEIDIKDDQMTCWYCGEDL